MAHFLDQLGPPLESWTSPLGLEGLLTNQAPQEGRMAARRTRRSFTREFKVQAVKRLLDGGKGLSEVATELGIGTGQLSQWRTEHLAAGSAEALAVRKRVYGSPRVHAELRREGLRHSRRRVERLMRAMGLSARRGRRRTPRTTDSRHDLPVAPNRLARDFSAETPDQVWLADVSYIPTGEGFLYLAAIKDMATREIVGWSMDDHLRA